ncbi:MAG: anti-sigma factor [Paeniglutamicibacter sp.]|uniref:anti-sigma factor n=1 Tax=Arthrobacter sp. UCD-GKA TaxID=1913576 RepID=UPI001113FF31|nr:anti-sigma factor [Arthrobacter sp. UCD-GKA]
MTGTDPAYPAHRGDENDDDLGMDLVDAVSTDAESPARRPLKRWMFVVAALAVVVIGLVAGLVNLIPTNYVSKVERASDQVVAQADLEGGGHAVLKTSAKADAGMIELTGLPAIDPTEDYVVWLIEASTDRPTLLATIAPSDKPVKEGFNGVDQLASVMVSVEPGDGSSTAPSTEPLAVLDLPEAK